jgi:hypothetical protein
LASLSAVTRDLPFGKAIVFRILFWFTALALLLVAWLVWALLRPAMFRRRIERARREFVRVRDSLESAFFSAAAATGKPRGLKWKQCAFQPGVLLARDRANGEFVGLVGVTIGFEAIEGGGMEDVEAVGNLRAATAVFTHNGRAWTTQGRAVFNLEPREVIERYKDQLDAI